MDRIYAGAAVGYQRASAAHLSSLVWRVQREARAKKVNIFVSYVRTELHFPSASMDLLTVQRLPHDWRILFKISRISDLLHW